MGAGGPGDSRTHLYPAAGAQGGMGGRVGSSYLPPFSLVPSQTFKAPPLEKFSFLSGAHHSATLPSTFYWLWGSGEPLALNVFLNFLHCEIGHLYKRACVTYMYCLKNSNKKQAPTHTPPSVKNKILPIH